MQAEVKLDRAALEEELGAVLPEYMVPRLWVELAELPLTGNGKVDRKGLPDPELSGLSGKEYVAPRTQEEQQLAEIWMELLGLDRVGIQDNFFELGGHSLLATRMVSVARNQFGIGIELNTIFVLPTIELLGKYISACLLQNLNQSNLATEIVL
jgi:acyl carrier protein